MVNACLKCHFALDLLGWHGIKSAIFDEFAACLNKAKCHVMAFALL
jgi:hypothetical protein